MPQNITYDDRDTTHLVYSPPGGWFFGTYNATSVGQTGTLATSRLTNGLNVSFLFPVPATDFYYFGIKRCCGGLYSICIDCDPINPKPIPIDAVDPTDNGQNPPVVLFSKHFTVPGIHAVVLVNEADPSGTPPGNSQITLSSFVITVPDSDTDTLTASTTEQSSSSSTFAPTSATASSSASSSPSHLPGIIGGVLGGLVLLLIIAGTWFWCWRRARQSPIGVGQAELGPPHQTVAPPDQNNLASTASMSFVSSGAVSTSQWTTATGSTAQRRERDAGRIDTTSDDTDTLPPEYGQVFGSRSRRASQQPSSPSNSGSESPPFRPMRRSKRLNIPE